MTAAVGIYITIPQMCVSRFLAGEFTCAGDLVFLFFLFFYLFAVIALAIQCITPVIFPLLFYSQEMSRLCRPSTNVNNVYAVYVRSVYIRAVFTFEEHPWLFIHVQIACMSKYSAHTPAHSQSENWKD
jgi:hypothetical protein